MQSFVISPNIKNTILENICSFHRNSSRTAYSTNVWILCWKYFYVNGSVFLMHKPCDMLCITGLWRFFKIWDASLSRFQYNNCNYSLGNMVDTKSWGVAISWHLSGIYLDMLKVQYVPRSQYDTSNGSWCMGIKGEMSGTVCVTFTWDMYIYMSCL